MYKKGDGQDELESNVSKMEETINNLQRKIDNISFFIMDKFMLICLILHQILIIHMEKGNIKLSLC